MKGNIEKYLSVRQVAEMVQHNTSFVMRRIRNKTLSARRVGWNWLIKEDDARELVESLKR